MASPVFICTSPASVPSCVSVCLTPRSFVPPSPCHLLNDCLWQASGLALDHGGEQRDLCLRNLDFHISFEKNITPLSGYVLSYYLDAECSVFIKPNCVKVNISSKVPHNM